MESKWWPWSNEWQRRWRWKWCIRTDFDSFEWDTNTGQCWSNSFPRCWPKSEMSTSWRRCWSSTKTRTTFWIAGRNCDRRIGWCRRLQLNLLMLGSVWVRSPQGQRGRGSGSLISKDRGQRSAGVNSSGWLIRVAIPRFGVPIQRRFCASIPPIARFHPDNGNSGLLGQRWSGWGRKVATFWNRWQIWKTKTLTIMNMTVII